MIIKVNAFSASIIFLQITLRGQKEQGRTRKYFEKFNTQMVKISATFPQISALSGQFSKKCRREVPIFPSSYTPVVIRKYRITLLTKFTMVKLNIDFLSVSTIFFKSALRWKLSVTCLEENSLHSPAKLRQSAKQLSRLSLGL